MGPVKSFSTGLISGGMSCSMEFGDWFRKKRVLMVCFMIVDDDCWEAIGKER